MSDLNRCEFIGRLGRDVETKYLPSGDPVANFSIAVGESWKDKSGQKQESTEWVNCVVFGRLAEVCEKYLAKGSRVYIAGKMKTRSWDKDGVKQYRTEINVRELQMLDGKIDQKAAPAVKDDLPFDDDCPF